MRRLDAYVDQFEAHANTFLGGLDLADEFFNKLHRDLRAGVRAVAMLHMVKGRSPQQGALVWFRQTLRPQLRRDYQQREAP